MLPVGETNIFIKLLAALPFLFHISCSPVVSGRSIQGEAYQLLGVECITWVVESSHVYVM